MTQIFKWLALCSAVLISLVVLVVAIWWLSPDEALAPKAQALLEKTPRPDQPNAYNALWGLLASPELEPHQAGHALWADYQKKLNEQGDRAVPDKKAFMGKNPLQLAKSGNPWCHRDAVLCLNEYIKHRTAITAATREHALYLARYRALRQDPVFEEGFFATIYQELGAYHHVGYFSALVDAHVALSMQTASQQAVALQDLVAEIAWWRQVNMSARQLITKMIANVSLHRQYRLLSELIATYPEIVNTHHDLIQTMTRRFDTQESSLRRIFEGEFRFNALVSNQIEQSYTHADAQELFDSNEEDQNAGLHKRWNRLISQVGYKPHATLNQLYQWFEHEAWLSEQPAPTLLAQTQTSPTLPSLYSWRFWCYNPIGHIVLNKNADYTDYMLRQQDLAAYVRLVELQRQIALQKIPAEKIAAFIAQQPEPLTNPYTGRPMLWDAATQKISFAPQSKNMQSANTAWVQLLSQSPGRPQD